MPTGGVTSECMCVALCIGEAAYQARLPHVLRRRGMLARLFRFGTDLEIFDPGHSIALHRIRRFGSYRIANRILWGGWRRLPGTKQSKLPQVASSWWADRLVARYVPAVSIFHGITGASVCSLEAASHAGAVTLIETAVQHPLRWQLEVLTECHRFGIHPRDCGAVLPNALVQRIQREYERCDLIIVQSHGARRGFEEFAYGGKARVIWAGVDHEFFSPAQRPPERFRVLYVGRVELAKGVPYLLEAWHRLQLRNGELVLAGEVRPEMSAILRRYASPSIKFLGFVPRAAVRDLYRQSSLLAMPSVNEGLAAVVLEAMSAGVPVLATDLSGAEDCIIDRKGGFIVPARNVDALSELIDWCYQHRDEARLMGTMGRAAVLSKFKLEDYEQRLVALYDSLLGRHRNQRQ